jgi:hypothetical protein
MGTPASGSVEIICRSEEAVQELCGLLGRTPQKLNQILADYYGDKCYVNFDTFGANELGVYLENGSERVQNTEWQLDLLFKFVREKAGHLIAEFTADISVITNHIYEEFEEEEICQH